MRRNPCAVDNMEETIVTTRKRTYTHHPFSERKRVVELYKEGHNSREISQRMQLDDSMVRSWIRKYREYGDAALQPYWRKANGQQYNPVVSFVKDRDILFSSAFIDYAYSLEPVASITRRFGLDYHAFKYHVERYHPELVARRNMLRTRTRAGWVNRAEKKNPILIESR